MRVLYTVTQSFFDMRKTLSYEETTARLLKNYLKGDGNKHFAIIEYKEFPFDKISLTN